MSDPSKAVEDVQALLDQVTRGEAPEVENEIQEAFGSIMGQRFSEALTRDVPKSRAEDKKLHFSEIGHPCDKHLWYKVNRPDLAEEMPSNAVMKFLYGDLIEELFLALVRLTGHEVTDEQKRCEVPLRDGWRITGRMDAKIDGWTTDVKSASQQAFKNYSNGMPEDLFGTKHQLRGYLSAEGELSGYFAVVDKTLGHITTVRIDDGPLTEQEKERLVRAVEATEPPVRSIESEPEGKSGNRKLGVLCSYCPFKHACWADANEGRGLRTFLYSNKPVFLTHVAKEPKVPEYTGE